MTGNTKDENEIKKHETAVKPAPDPRTERIKRRFKRRKRRREQIVFNYTATSSKKSKPPATSHAHTNASKPHSKLIKDDSSI